MSGLWTLLVGNAIPVVALSAVAFFVSRTFRRPALTHLLWVLVLVKLVTPPLLPWSISVSEETAAAIGIAADAESHAKLPDPASRQLVQQSQSPLLDEGPSTVPSDGSERVETTEPVVSSAPPAASPLGATLSTFVFRWLRTNWLLVAGLIWISGTLVSVVCIGRMLVCLSRSFRTAEPIDSRARRHVDSLAASLGLRSAPDVRLVSGIVSPLVWGVGPYTRIIFPRTLWEELSASSRDALLLHELAHCRRGDQWIRVLEIVVGCLYWWHPCVWWARRELAAAEEECCDAWVVRQAGHQPRNYAEAIITTLDYLAGEPVRGRAITTGVDTMPVLKRRLRNIMQKTVSPELPQPVRWGMLVGAAVLLPLQPFLQVVPRAAVAAIVSPERTGESIAESMERLGDSLLSPSETATAATRWTDPQPAEPVGFWSQFPSKPARSFIISPTGRYKVELQFGSDAVAVIDNDSQRRSDLAGEGISCLAFTPDGERFVTGSRSGDVRLWQASDGKAVSQLGNVGDDRVTSIDVSVDGTWVVTGSDAGSVMVWELVSGAPLAAWDVDSSRVNCVRVMDENRIAISTGHFLDGAAGRLLILDLATHETILDQSTQRLIAAIELSERSQGGLLLTDYSGTVWEWDGLGPELTDRGVVSKSDMERAVFSPAFRIADGLER